MQGYSAPPWSHATGVKWRECPADAARTRQSRGNETKRERERKRKREKEKEKEREGATERRKRERGRGRGRGREREQRQMAKRDGGVGVGAAVAVAIVAACAAAAANVAVMRATEHNAGRDGHGHGDQLGNGKDNVLGHKNIVYDGLQLVVDEQFHVPQAKRYCAGQWDVWDNKITTLPGMYYMSAAINMLASDEGSIAWCSTKHLRATLNIPAAALAAVAMYLILSTNRRYTLTRTSQSSVTTISGISIPCALQAIALSQFPLHFFFSGLYYTDCVSTAMVLIAYAMAQRSVVHVSAWCLCLAVFIRQTNVIWCLFIWALTVLDISDPGESIVLGIHNLPSAVKLLLKRVWLHRSRIILKTSLQLVPVASLAYFVYVNGSIVAGDKEAHKPELHIMQFLYCLGFCTAAAAPFLITPIRYASFD